MYHLYRYILYRYISLYTIYIEIYSKSLDIIYDIYKIDGAVPI